MTLIERDLAAALETLWERVRTSRCAHYLAKGGLRPKIEAALAAAKNPTPATGQSQPGIPEDKLMLALAESLKLQSHYAGLLNDYDGGKRIQFATPAEWIERIDSIREGAK